MPRANHPGHGGICVTDHKLASIAGQTVLRRGGNAIDAAVACAAALSVVDPYMSGFCGFGYALYYNSKDDRVYCFDFVGEAPQAASTDLYTREQPWEDFKPSAEGILAGLVPGVVSGWSALLERFGEMKWADVLAPAQQLTRGFKVSRHLHQFYESVKPRAAMNPITARVFYGTGSYPKPGETFVQPELARTLKTLGEKGPADFYQGSIGKKIAKYVKEAGGIISEEDLARYRTKAVEPIKGEYRGHILFSLPPGSSGITILQWLNIIEGYDLDRMEWNSPEFIHLFLEAGKLALRDDDMYNTGKDYLQVPVQKLTSKEYALGQLTKLSAQRAAFHELVHAPQNYPSCTTHLCTCDIEGNIVSLTQTQMYGFDRVGLIGDLGFNLNGGMCYFNMNPKHPERLEPGQRPRYVMSPTIALKDGSAVTAGAAGGWTIPQTITETLSRILDFRMEPQKAVSGPRWVMRYRTNSIPYAQGTVVELENGIPNATRAALAKKGHRIISMSKDLSSMGRLTLNFGAVNALMWSEGRMRGGAETRRDGLVASE